MKRIQSRNPIPLTEGQLREQQHETKRNGGLSEKRKKKQKKRDSKEEMGVTGT